MERRKKHENDNGKDCSNIRKGWECHEAIIEPETDYDERLKQTDTLLAGWIIQYWENVVDRKAVYNNI